MATAQITEPRTEIQFRQLLEEAVSKPGTLMVTTFSSRLKGRLRIVPPRQHYEPIVKAR